MTTAPERRPLARRRSTWIVTGAVLAVAGVALAVHLSGGADGFSLDTAGLGSWTSLAVALLVFGDAICAVLPGETTLNAAAILAADGELELWLVILAGAAGAIVGDSTLYWIARGFSSRVGPRLEKATANQKVASVLDLLGRRASVLLVAGRYVPGARFVVNATLGLSRYPSCVLAYVVATALSGFPLASAIISGAISTLAIGVVIVVLRRSRRAAPA